MAIDNNEAANEHEMNRPYQEDSDGKTDEEIDEGRKMFWTAL
jgi:hypothetical protein